MKTSKITKSEITKALRSENPTAIYKAAHLSGVDVTNSSNVFYFIQDNAPSTKVYNKAYDLSIGASLPNQLKKQSKNVSSPLLDVISFAKEQRNAPSDYKKVLLEGNDNIYWVSPVYGHSDYNKSIAFKNTPSNKKVAEKINLFINA